MLINGQELKHCDRCCHEFGPAGRAQTRSSGPGVFLASSVRRLPWIERMAVKCVRNFMEGCA